ncbi:MAG TPA: hypothetical protein VFX59_24915, partial [Polyangiales bacterium]|nr:hypothetical protein [Polyangiales bacterium]
MIFHVKAPFLLCCLLLACARESAPHAAAAPPERVTEAPPRLSPQVIIDDPRLLASIEEQVADFGVLALGAAQSGLANAQLASLPAHRELFAPIERDLHALTANDPQAGVSVRGHAHRTFDVRWLRAESARFRLIAIANRMDRRAFDRDGCGETRLIYRLRYTQGEVSRLPFTIALELRQGGDCAEQARRWQRPESLLADGGPLQRPSREQLVQLALNVQAVRWPSAVRPDLGGHAEYLLRAFRWNGARYVPRALENTPDVVRLARERAARDELATWLIAHADEVDRGVALLPERFLAEVVTSVTPRGFARLANRPFAQLFAPARFDKVPAGRFVRSPEAFVRRLDELSCNGCHQARSVAGFHQLGLDDEAPASNALAIGHSPHVHDDLARRTAYVRALAEGRTPDDAQPFAEHARDEGVYGAHCGLGDPSFASWTCAAGLHCDGFEGDSVGACLGESAVGDPCEPARVGANADPHRDRARAQEPRACAGVCE